MLPFHAFPFDLTTGGMPKPKPEMSPGYRCLRLNGAEVYIPISIHLARPRSFQCKNGLGVYHLDVTPVRNYQPLLLPPLLSLRRLLMTQEDKNIFAPLLVTDFLSRLIRAQRGGARDYEGELALMLPFCSRRNPLLIMSSNFFIVHRIRYWYWKKLVISWECYGSALGCTRRRTLIVPTEIQSKGSIFRSLTLLQFIPA